MANHTVDFLVIPKRPLGPLQFALLLCLAAGGATVLASLLFQGRGGINFEIFLSLLVFYAVASTAFVISQVRRHHFPLFDLPVFFTALCFVRSGLVPLAVFLDPSDFLNGYYRNPDYRQLDWTFALFIAGMLAFWSGCRLCSRKVPEASVLEDRTKNRRSQTPVVAAVGLLLASLASRIYVTYNYGWVYGMNLDVYFDNLALMQVLNTLTELGTVALAVATIEMCYHPRNVFRRFLFASVFLNEVFWGALSGMKQNVFRNFLLVAAVLTLTRAKVDKKWIAAVLLGFVLVYPVENRYRRLLHGSVDVKRVGSLEQAAHTAATDTAAEEAGWKGWLRSGAIETVTRLDLLQAMTVTVSLDAWQADRVRGDERWWMAPIYPFVPRFLWPSKPMLLRGERLSLVLGLPASTSTAPTYPGDLYMEYGAGGVLVGMFLLGLVLQWVTNRVVEHPQKGDLFFYSGFFMLAINVIETDSFSVWTTLIKLGVMFAVMRYLIYGSRRRRHSDRQPPGVEQTVPDLPGSERAFLPVASRPALSRQGFAPHSPPLKP